MKWVFLLFLFLSAYLLISHQNFLLFLFNSLEKEKFPFYLNKSENVTMQKKVSRTNRNWHFHLQLVGSSRIWWIEKNKNGQCEQHHAIAGNYDDYIKMCECFEILMKTIDINCAIICILDLANGFCWTNLIRSDVLHTAIIP